MKGHGWVRPNWLGVKARCGGPAICEQCRLELAELRGVSMDIQLFDRAGNLVATVHAPLDNGRTADAVKYQDRIFALKNGRYVEVPAVPARNVA